MNQKWVINLKRLVYIPHIYYFFDDIINIKIFDPNSTKIIQKFIQKYSYLLHWICNEQRFEICQN